MSAVADVRPALIGHLKDLHLPTVRECYEATARQAERETLSYTWAVPRRVPSWLPRRKGRQRRSWRRLGRPGCASAPLGP